MLYMAYLGDIIPAKVKQGGQVMKLKPSISSLVRWCNGAMAKAVLFTALVFMCGIFVSCGGNSDVNGTIAPSNNLTIEPEDLPINLQVGDASELSPSPLV